MRGCRDNFQIMSKIDHIEFWVSDLEKSIIFYEQLFRLINWNKVDANGFSDGESKIYFIQQSVWFLNTVGPRHICFAEDSKEMVDNVGKFLKQNAGYIIRGPIHSVYKERHSYTIDFKDPDGYILEVTKSLD